VSYISDCAVFGSRAIPGVEQSLAIWDPGQQEANQLRLSTRGGVGELAVRIALKYLVEVTNVQAFAARTTSYRYLVSDIAGQDLVAYDWHPTGSSRVITPHLHVPAAGSVILAQRPGSRLEGAKTHLGAMHLPTGPISLAVFVSLLITEFQVDPIRSDWERVLEA
jgi:hypothetical protein